MTVSILKWTLTLKLRGRSRFARDETLAEYPYLEEEDITAVLEFAARQIA